MEDKQKTSARRPISEKQQITAPMAMAELEIMKLENAKSAAAKNLGIRNIAILIAVLLGVNLFSQICSYLIISSFNTAQTNFFSTFVDSNGFFGITALLIQIVALFILFFTRSTTRAKIILLVTGICFGTALVNSILSFRIGPAIVTDIAIVAVNFFIVGKIFKVYVEL